MSESKTKVYKMLSSFNELKWSVAGKGVLAGLVAGLLASLYRYIIQFGTKTATGVYAYFKIHPIFILPWLVAIVLAGLFVAWLIKLEPMATGSGIPQVEGVVLFGMKMKWYTILVVRFVAGGLCGMFGLSLGREGPSIQIGAAGGQMVAKATGKKQNRGKLSHYWWRGGWPFSRF